MGDQTGVDARDFAILTLRALREQVPASEVGAMGAIGAMLTELERDQDEGTGRDGTEEWLQHARTELAPKLASSAYVITINPDDIDPKIALETGYAILLDKPILLLVPAGGKVNAGLRRIATEVVELTAGLDTDAGQQQLQAALATMPGSAS